MRLGYAGYTLVEVLVVIAILAIIAQLVVSNFMDATESALYSRAQLEAKQFENALQQYRNANNGAVPPDADRDIPPGLENYLAGDNWPNAPWAESVYDWDNWTIGGEQVIQLSIRFCPQGGPIEDCNFPGQDWAENFDVNASVFYCFDGPCRSHDTEPRDHPGYCINCNCQEMEACH